jgi:hypothetical protein
MLWAIRVGYILKKWVADLGINTIKDGLSLKQISTEQIGPDLKSRYRVGAH